MKSFFSKKLYLHPLAIPWTRRIESLRKYAVVEFSGGDYRRLRCENTGDFGPEPETPAKDSGLPNLVF
jgi:hypothetical protein